MAGWNPKSKAAAGWYSGGGGSPRRGGDEQKQEGENKPFGCCLRYHMTGKHSESCEHTVCHMCGEKGHVGYTCPKAP